MKRSILIVCAVGSAILLGTLVSRGDSPDKAADGTKKSAPRKKPIMPETPVRRTGTAAIEAALAQRVPCEFVETPLKDVIDYLRDALKVEIWLDEKGLKDAGVDPEVPVSCNLRGCSVSNVLNIVVDKLQLAWAIHDDVLWITSPVKADSAEFQDTRVYDVSDLVVYQDEKGVSFDDYLPLMDTITNSIDQKSWLDNGGDGTIHGETLGAAKVLVVSQSYQVQRKIVLLLAQIRAIAGTESKDHGRPRRERQKDPQVNWGGGLPSGWMKNLPVPKSAAAGNNGNGPLPKSGNSPSTK